MKDLSNYLVEKLKLSDIKITRYGWIDARLLSLDDIKEGYILETAEKSGENRYLCVGNKIGSNFFRLSNSDDYILLQTDYRILNKYTYLRLNDYDKDFPKYNRTNKFDIVKVYIREKHYNSAEEARLDLLNIYKF